MTGTICPACEEHHIHPVPRGAEYPTGWGCESCGAGGRDAELGDYPCPAVSVNGYRCERVAHPVDRIAHRAILTNGTQLVEWEDGQTATSPLVTS